MCLHLVVADANFDRRHSEDRSTALLRPAKAYASVYSPVTSNRGTGLRRERRRRGQDDEKGVGSVARPNASTGRPPLGFDRSVNTSLSGAGTHRHHADARLRAGPRRASVRQAANRHSLSQPPSSPGRPRTANAAPRAERTRGSETWARAPKMTISPARLDWRYMTASSSSRGRRQGHSLLPGLLHRMRPEWARRSTTKTREVRLAP